MKKEITVMAICALALLTVEAYCPVAKPVTKALVLIIEAGVLWAFVSAFCKA